MGWSLCDFNAGWSQNAVTTFIALYEFVQDGAADVVFAAEFADNAISVGQRLG